MEIDNKIVKLIESFILNGNANIKLLVSNIISNLKKMIPQNELNLIIEKRLSDKNIYFIRHAEAIHNVLEQKYNGDFSKCNVYDPKLTENGINQTNYTIKKLETLKIETEGERKIMDVFEKMANKMKMGKDKFFNILFLTSGKINLSDSILTINLNDISKKYKIKLVNYTINQNEKFENEEFLNSLNKMIQNNENKFITLQGNNESNEKNIEILKNLFK